MQKGRQDAESTLPASYVDAAGEAIDFAAQSARDFDTVVTSFAADAVTRATQSRPGPSLALNVSRTPPREAFRRVEARSSERVAGEHARVPGYELPARVG